MVIDVFTIPCLDISRKLFRLMRRTSKLLSLFEKNAVRKRMRNSRTRNAHVWHKSVKGQLMNFKGRCGGGKVVSSTYCTHTVQLGLH